MQLQINGLSHTYGATSVFENLNLQVASGESMALLGPSGCGKTTLLRSIAGLEQPASGTISLGGRLVTSERKFLPPEKRKVGMVFQDWALFPHISVSRNVAFGLARSERSSNRVAEVLELVGLAGFEDRMPSSLSGGQQQRVALARALAPQPEILLLDEPFSNLDSNLRTAVRTEVRQLLLDLEITTVLVTHDQDEAFVMGDRVGVLHNRALVQVGTPAELYRHPVDRFVANFVGTASWIGAVGIGDSAHSVLGELLLSQPALGPIEVMLRPEQLTITPVSLDAGDRGFYPQGTVSVIEYYGHDVMAVVGLGDEQVRVRCEPDLVLKRGDMVNVAFTGTTVTHFERETATQSEATLAAAHIDQAQPAPSAQPVPAIAPLLTPAAARRSTTLSAVDPPTDPPTEPKSAPVLQPVSTD